MVDEYFSTEYTQQTTQSGQPEEREGGMRPPAPNLLNSVGGDQGDASLVYLYRRYANWLEAMVRRSGGGDTSADIVQETYIRLARYPADAVIRHPQALLMRVAQNLLRNAARRERAEKRVTPSAAALGLCDRVDADQLEWVALRETILSLPQAYRDVFVLSRFGGMSNEQVAQACNLTVKAVEWRMSKALALCAARMRD